MSARITQDPTYTVVINGKTVGEVRRPVDRRVFGRARGTVYIARPIHKGRAALAMGEGRTNEQGL